MGKKTWAHMCAPARFDEAVRMNFPLPLNSNAADKGKKNAKSKYTNSSESI